MKLNNCMSICENENSITIAPCRNFVPNHPCQGLDGECPMSNQRDILNLTGRLNEITKNFKDNLAEFNIVVNGIEKKVMTQNLKYADLIALAFDNSNEPNVTFTITYRNGHPWDLQGILVKDAQVRIKNRMIFNVALTNKV